jgi:drug/metabolite transporter (DMT)-like permease
MAAAVAYAGIHIIARKIGGTESAATMAFYIQITFIVVCIIIGLFIGDGRYSDQSHPSLVFLFKEWTWPLLSDAGYFAVLGFGVAFGGYLISQAYRSAEAGFVAPFEYLAMPLSVLWGFLVFEELPSKLTWLGIGLIVGAGLFTVWREQKAGQDYPVPKTRR